LGVQALKYRDLLMLSLCLPLAGWAQQPPANPTNAPPAQRIVLPKSVPDPIEPVNRVMWDFNKGLMKVVIEPTSRVYRFVVEKPVRTAIGYLAQISIIRTG
jgi:ABC-type transporter lipoprotein component MlaA